MPGDRQGVKGESPRAVQEEHLPPATQIIEERVKSILSSNDSPDVHFDLSVNPYRGCEHGCVYCFARPTHSYLNMSPGLEILQAAANAGATSASSIVLRLPWEVNPIFQHWLDEHFPDRAARVMARVREMRGGKDYDSRFGARMKGEGVWAQLLQQRFTKAVARFGLNRTRIELDLTQFKRPKLRPKDGQAELF